MQALRVRQPMSACAASALVRNLARCLAAALLDRKRVTRRDAIAAATERFGRFLQAEAERADDSRGHHRDAGTVRSLRLRG